MIGLSIALVVIFGLATLLRWLGSLENPKVVSIVPPNMQALVTNKANKKTKLAAGGGGGNITNIIHVFPGKKIDKRSSDPFEWHYKKDRERRGLLFYLLGIQFIWFYRGLLLNDIRTFRFGRTDEEKEYHVMPKSDKTRYFHCSGQHDIEMKSVDTMGTETLGILRINIRLNILWETTYPVRFALKVADPFAVMTQMITRLVIGLLGQIDPYQLVGSQAKQDEIARLIEKLSSEVEKYLGLTIVRATIDDISFDKDTQELLEKEKKAEIENRVRVKNSEAALVERLNQNNGEVDYIERVTMRVASNPEAVRARWAQAHENNNTLTTVVYGGGASPVVPVGGDLEKKVKEK